VIVRRVRIVGWLESLSGAGAEVPSPAALRRWSGRPADGAPIRSVDIGQWAGAVKS
jgi:hypothetical protein